MPNSARSTRNTASVGANAEANSSREYSSTLAISAPRRPNRSAIRPNSSAPIGRIAIVTKIASVTLAILAWKSPAMEVSTNTTRKKSNASSIQPR